MNITDFILSVCSDIEFEIRRLKSYGIVSPAFEQVKRSSTAIGANYCEAMGCHTEKDYRKTVGVSLKECNETIWWIELLDNDFNLSKYKTIIQSLYEIKKALEENILYSAENNCIPTEWGEKIQKFS